MITLLFTHLNVKQAGPSHLQLNSIFFMLMRPGDQWDDRKTDLLRERGEKRGEGGREDGLQRPG